MDVNYLHESIRRGEIEIVKDLLEENPPGPGERYYKQYVSAARAAIEGTSKSEEIYELLVSRGISLGPHEHMDEIFENTLNDQKKRLDSGKLPSSLGRVFEKKLKDKKERLRQINKKHQIDPNLKHILILTKASKFSHDTNNEIHAYSSAISKAFAELNDIPELEQILKVASTAKGLKIVFDPTRNSVEVMDPTKSKFTFGTTYHNEAYIYVGAKGLISKTKKRYAINNPRKDERNEVLGTLIHELHHLAMHLLYANSCKPYRSDDSETIEKFSRIAEICCRRQDQNEIIKRAFSYKNIEILLAELIVRVPELYALYKDNPTKLSEVRKNFNELFEFFNTRTIHDLKAAYPELNARHEIREINELCGTLAELEKSEIPLHRSAINIDLDADTKVLNFSSNVVKITMKTIYEKLRNENKLENYIFVNMKTLLNEKVFDLILKGSKLPTNPTIVIDCENADEMNLGRHALQLNSKEMNQRIIVTDMVRGDPFQLISLSTTKVSITHTWNHLSGAYQSYLVKREVSFQGKEIPLEEIIDRNSINCLKYFPLNQLIEKKIIKIGNELPSLLDEVYIERKFLERASNTGERKFLCPSMRPQANSVTRYFKTRTNPQTYTMNEYIVDEILQCVQSEKVILISDTPGMGKSTVLKVIANTCKDKMPESWIVFMDLKQYYETYQRDGQVTNKFTNCEGITKFFCENILKINNFEREVFTRLFNSDRVTILMDGFDEISPSFKEFNLNLMKAIKNNSGNQLWISTRPHLEKELEDLEPLSLEMRPFDKLDCEKLFQRHLDNKKYCAEEYICIYTRSYNFCHTNELFGRESRVSPLLLKMIIETMEDKVKIDNFVLNEYEIYDESMKKQIKNTMEKGPDAKDDIAAESCDDSLINDFHYKIAFRQIFQNDPVAEKMVDTCFSCKPPAVEKAVRFGLMYFDESNFFFVHRTYAEFFVSKYIYKTIFAQEKRFTREDVEVTAEMLANILTCDDEKYQMVFTFLEQALKLVSPDSYLKKNAKLKPILSASFMSKLSVAGNYLNFEVLIKAESINLLSLLFQVIPPDYLLQVFDRKRIIENLQDATKTVSVDFFKNFWSLFDDKVGSKCLQEIFINKNGMDDNLFHTAIIFRKLDIFSFLLKKSLPISDEESDNHLLFACDKRGCNILHWMLYYWCFEDYLLLKIGEIFASLNESQIKRLMLAQYQFDACRSNILSSDFNAFDDVRNVSNAIEYFCKELNKMTTDDEVAPLLLAIGEFGYNVLMNAARSLSKNGVKALWDLIKEKLSTEETKMILSSKEKYGKTVFQFAMENKDPEVFIFIKAIYDETLSIEILRKQVLRGINLLECVEFHHVTISNLFQYVRETFNAEESEFVNDFFQMTETLWCSLKFCKLMSLKTLINDARKTFTTKTFEQILLKKTADDNKTIFHFAIQNSDPKVFTFVKEIYAETFSINILKGQVLTGINLLECTEFNSVTNSNLFKYLRETFTEESEFVKNFFQMRTLKRPPLRYCQLESLKALIHLAKESFTEKTFEEILLMRLKAPYESTYETIFHFALISEATGVWTFIKEIFAKTLSIEILKANLKEHVFKRINLLDCIVDFIKYHPKAISNLFQFLRETFPEESELKELFFLEDAPELPLTSLSREELRVELDCLNDLFCEATKKDILRQYNL